MPAWEAGVLGPHESCSDQEDGAGLCEEVNEGQRMGVPNLLPLSSCEASACLLRLPGLLQAGPQMLVDQSSVCRPLLQALLQQSMGGRKRMQGSKPSPG